MNDIIQENFSCKNTVSIKTSTLILETDRPVLESSDKLRGYISHKFPEYPIFHNHLNDDEYIYTYPRVQYRIIDGKAYILGIEEGAKLMKMLSDIDKLTLEDNVYDVRQKIFYDTEEKIMPMTKLLQYKFITPWLGLSQKNYPKFKILKDWREKKIMLNNILIGNIISMSKGLSFDIEKDIYAHSKLKEIRTKYKDTIVSGFVGEFRTNFKIPDFFGLGKGVSRGFGVIKNEEILPLKQGSK